MTTADRVAERVQLSPEQQEIQQLSEQLMKVQSRLGAQVEKRYPGHHLSQEIDRAEWVKIVVIRPGDGDRKNVYDISYLMNGQLHNDKTDKSTEVFISPDGTAFCGKFIVYSSGGDYGRRVFIQPSSLPDGRGRTELFANGLSVLSDPKNGVGTGETFHLKVALYSIRGYFSRNYLTETRETVKDQDVRDALGYFEGATPVDPANPYWRQRVRKALIINL